MPKIEAPSICAAFDKNNAWCKNPEKAGKNATQILSVLGQPWLCAFRDLHTRQPSCPGYSASTTPIDVRPTITEPKIG